MCNRQTGSFVEPGRKFRVADNHPEQTTRNTNQWLLDERIALIWSDCVNSAKSVGVFVIVLAPSRGQSEQQPGQVERRLISLIFAGRNRIIMIRRELPLTVIANPAEPVA